MRRTAPLLLLLTSACFGYIRLNTGETPPVPLQRVDNTGIQFYLNNLIVPGAQSSASGKAVTVISANSNPQAAMRAALLTWNAVSTANVTFLPLQSTTVGHNSTDGLMVISIASAAADVSAVGSALAITVNSWTAGGGLDPYNSALTVTDGSIVDSDVLLNPGVAFSTDGSTTADLQAVMTHEFGHSLGANHTGVLGATMFQAPAVNARLLSTDDLAFVNSVYPATSNAVTFGTISGTVTLGGSPVSYGLLTFVDTTQGISLGGLTNSDGTYSIKVPSPGSYTTYVEPFNTIVQPGNLYLTAAQAALVSTFEPTLLSAPVAVSASNNLVTQNISVTSGKSALTVPLVGFGASGKTGDISSFSTIIGPIEIASGKAFDIAFSGTGLNSTLTDTTIAVYGPGINAGPLRLDSVTVNGLPVVRMTLTIAAQQTTSLATVFITKGTSTLSMTGLLVVTPPTPSFTAPGVVSAVSDLTGVVGNGTVSPGEYVTLYGTSVSPTNGPYAGIGYTNTGYLMGFLPQILGGTSVTFNGVPAPIFFTGAGGQINLQVPFEVAGKTSATVVASFFGSPSTAITVPVVPVHPALFSFPTATAVYAANSADYSTITSTNPAARGSTIIVVGTGFGLPTYGGTPLAIQTGAPAPVPPAYNPDSPWTCTIGGMSAPVLYSAWFSGFAAEAEWYVTVPAGLTTTGAVPIVFTNSGVSTQSNMTVYIK